MQQVRRKLLLEFYKLLDCSIMLAVLAFVLVFFSTVTDERLRNPLQFFSSHIKLVNFLLLIALFFLWPAIFSSFGLYRSQRLNRNKRELFDIAKAVGIGTMIFATLSLVLNREDINVLTLSSFWLLCTVLTYSARATLRRVLFLLRKHGRNLRNFVVVGSGKRAHALATKLAGRKEAGYSFLGFVDEDCCAPGVDQENGLVCRISEFPEFLGNHVVDEVFITLPVKSYYSEISTIVRACEEQGIPVNIPGDFFQHNGSTVTSVVLGDTPFIVHDHAHTEEISQFLWKRTIDIAISLFMIILFLPVFLTIGLLIKLTSKGPILFVQDRVGYNKRVFKLLKFRTMVCDAEARQAELEHLNEADGPIFKMKNDPRVTKVGKLLRKTSLDELPQLFNVLRGDMSLVGPRPLPLRDVKLFDNLWYKRRFSVRPGITGLWQINGRSETEFSSLIKYDLEYIDKWSPWLDLKIMLKTVPAVLFGTGAM